MKKLKALKKAINKHLKNDVLGRMSRGINAVQIFTVKEGQLEANWKAIDDVFIRNKNVSHEAIKVIVICGLPRKGKSTLCNLFLRIGDYVELGDDVVKHVDDLGVPEETRDSVFQETLLDMNQSKDEDLKTNITKVFDTKSTTKTHTNGIWITSEPIIQYLSGGRKVSVLIADCQGVCGSDMNDAKDDIDHKIFVLGALMASHLIYNIDGLMQKHDEQLLKTFASSAKTLLAETHEKPFQKLFILLRDWNNVNDFKYGFEGGKNYYKSLTKETKTNDFDLFNSLFERVDCFLMPEPNDIIRKQMKGRDSDAEVTLDDFGEEFIHYVCEFISTVMSPKDKTIKCLGSTKNVVDGTTFKELLSDWFRMIKNGELYEIHSIFKTQSDKVNAKEANEAKLLYMSKITPECQKLVQQISVIDFESEIKCLKQLSKSYKDNALKQFQQKAWNNGKGIDVDYVTKLRTEIDADFDEFIRNVTVLRTAWFNYIGKMRIYLTENDNIVEKLINGHFNEENMKLFKKSCTYFLRNSEGNREKFGVKLKHILKQKMRKCFELISEYTQYLREALRTYNEKMEDGFKKRKFYEINSNKWLELDNIHFQSTMRELSKNIRDEPNELKINFKDLFSTKVEEFFKLRYCQSYINENFTNVVVGGIGGIITTTGAVCFPLSVTGALVATGSTIVVASTGIGLVVVGGVAILGVGGFLLCRKFCRPKRIKEETKKNQ